LNVAGAQCARGLRQRLPRRRRQERGIVLQLLRLAICGRQLHTAAQQIRCILQRQQPPAVDVDPHGGGWIPQVLQVSVQPLLQQFGRDGRPLLIQKAGSFERRIA